MGIGKLVGSLVWVSLLGLRVVAAGPPDGPAALRPLDPAAEAAVIEGKIHPALAGAVGEVDVIVRLADPPLAKALGPNAKRKGTRLTVDQRTKYLRSLQLKQDEVVRAIRSQGGQEFGRLTRALNAVLARIDGSRLRAVAELGSVRTIGPVVDYQLDLSQSVPYVGAAAVQALGYDGSGITVAVLDSGIDYTHANLGGPGTVAAYQAAYGTNPADPLNTTTNTTSGDAFPTAKVIGGFDYVGEEWPFGPQAYDPDPIDYQGHGTHVADILGGVGPNKGVAPGVKLFAIKVCSARSSACSGFAIFIGLDQAMDPDFDPATDDAVDVVNLSLGAAYGQPSDDLTTAVNNLAEFGIVVVCAAGNDGDKPYVLGSPANAQGAIAAAQTEAVHGLKVTGILGTAVTFWDTADVSWAPIDRTVQAPIVYLGRGCPGDEYLPGDVAGKIVMVDRGECSVSLKVDRAAKAGAVGVLLAMLEGQDPYSFGFGGGDIVVPTLVITKADADKIRGALAKGKALTGYLAPLFFAPQSGRVVVTSSRGPSVDSQLIKPDIGAPGASVSAVVGTGNGVAGFGGTSGATPMVAGSAALLLDRWPTLAPFEVKSLLMNYASTTVRLQNQSSVLAPITRTGAGELRVDKAARAKLFAYEKTSKSPSLSFGYQAFDLTAPSTFTKTVVVRNLDNKATVCRPAATFRSATQQQSKAVRIACRPAAFVLPANGTAEFQVTLTVDAAKLPAWALNGGAEGGNGDLLRQQEFDGYVLVNQAVQLPWHLLPHKAANVNPSTTSVVLSSGTGTLDLTNPNGAVTGFTELFDLVGTSPMLPSYDQLTPSAADLKAAGVRAVDSEFGPLLQFAIGVHGQWSHPSYPAEFWIYLDTNGDDDYDFFIFNHELVDTSFEEFALYGQNVVYVFDGDFNLVGIPFYTGVDLNASTAVLSVPLAMLDLLPGQQIRFFVLAGENYYNFPNIGVVDRIVGPAAPPYLLLIHHTVGWPRYQVAGSQTVATPANGTTSLTVNAIPGGDVASPLQSGLLLLHYDAKVGRWSDEVTVTDAP